MSVWSTIESQLQLRETSFYGIVLLMLWCLSPLGSQASLRVLQRGQYTNSTSVFIRYPSTGPAASISTTFIDGIEVTRFSSVLESPPRVKARHQDLYGGIKIPRIEALTARPTADGWQAVPPVLAPDDFSSLLGLRVIGLPRHVDTRFSLESTYCRAQCTPFVQLPYALNLTAADVAQLSARFRFDFAPAAAAGFMPGRSRYRGSQGSVLRVVMATDGAADARRFQAYMAPDTVATPLSDPTFSAPRWFVFGALYFVAGGRGGHAINLTNCTLSEIRVESAVYCPRAADGGDCRVQRMRRSLADARPPALTLLDDPVTEQRTVNILPKRFQGPANASSALEHFLYGNAFAGRMLLPFAANTSALSVDLARVPPDAFSRRLGIVLNTHVNHLISLNDDAAFTDRFGALRNVSSPAADMHIFAPPPPLTATAAAAAGGVLDAAAFRHFENATRARISRAMDANLPFVPLAATAAAQAHAPVFVCRFAWLAALLLAAAALGATGAAALALQLRGTLAPDVLRCVAAGLAWANAPGGGGGGSALDGMARTRLLHDVRVRVGDVNGGGDVGEVAFVAVDDVPTRKLERQRLYF
jgi:hypothetical protein